jgi:hypothetical protein
MRRSFSFAAIGLLSGLLALLAGPARAEDIETVIQKLADPRTADMGVVDENFVGTSIAEGKRIQLNHDQLVKLMKEGQAAITSYTIKKFTMLSKTEDGPFVSVVYEILCDYTIEKRPVSEKLTAHEIYERQGDGYKLLYGAQVEDLLSSL